MAQGENENDRLLAEVIDKICEAIVVGTRVRKAGDGRFVRPAIADAAEYGVAT